MERHRPGYFDRFRCLAGACPHTCCACWEVPVDEESAAAYQSVPGELGGRLRSALTTDGEGEACFALTDGRCPFLDGEGLCQLQRTWGENVGTPAVCREHPRFSDDYGPVREEGLCGSCPAAAGLILGTDFTLVTDELPGTGEADPRLAPLLRARETAFALLEADAPLSQRLQAILLLGNDLQDALDEGDTAALDEIAQFYSQGFPLLEEDDLPSRWESLEEVLYCLKKLEHLQPQWTDLLAAARAALDDGELPFPPDRPGTRAAAYFLYRHWLRSLNDGDLLSWCELSVLGTAVAGALAPHTEGGFEEAFRLFCQEVEHSQPNLDALQDAFWYTLTLSHIFSLTQKPA